RLVNRLKFGIVNAFIGAGAVVSCGFPTWQRLLDELGSELDAAHMQQMLKDLEDPLWRAEEYRVQLGPRYYSFIEQRFGPRSEPISQLVQDIVALNVRHIFTTNYDTSLESAFRLVHGEELLPLEWNDLKAVRNFLNALYEPTGRQHIYIVHL